MEAVIKVKVWAINHWVKKHSTGAVIGIKASVCNHSKKTLEVIHIFDVFKKNASNFLFAVENLVIPSFYQASSGLHREHSSVPFCSN